MKFAARGRRPRQNIAARPRRRTGVTRYLHRPVREMIAPHSAARTSARSATSQASIMANHLAGETSPYLLQHAHNPVDWWPWTPEALTRAKLADRPIFLSIGYAACHWCHVMERESFEDEATAGFLNEHFVPIKVDREER